MNSLKDYRRYRRELCTNLIILRSNAGKLLAELPENDRIKAEDYILAVENIKKELADTCFKIKQIEQKEKASESIKHATTIINKYK